MNQVLNLHFSDPLHRGEIIPHKHPFPLNLHRCNLDSVHDLTSLSVFIAVTGNPIQLTRFLPPKTLLSLYSSHLTWHSLLHNINSSLGPWPLCVNRLHKWPNKSFRPTWHWQHVAPFKSDVTFTHVQWQHLHAISSHNQPRPACAQFIFTHTPSNVAQQTIRAHSLYSKRPTLSGGPCLQHRLTFCITPPPPIVWFQCMLNSPL